MVKTIVCAKRKPGMSREAFLDYWQHQHGALVKQYKDALRIVRYVQSHSLDNEVSENFRRARGGLEMYDGIGEAWFNSLDDLRALGQDEGSRNALLALVKDEAQFVDQENSRFWVSEEVEII
ncbi:MAG: EthD domain-containing protein [Acidobacteriota bacterium]